MTPGGPARRPVALVVLDGWGWREAESYNAIKREAHGFYELLGRYPNALLSASGKEVGLPRGLMGNSEVGHMNMGAGRIVYQDIARIDDSIERGDFFENGALVGAMEHARERNARVHLVGLVSDGGVHSSDAHLRALLDLARRRGLGSDRVLVHAILDGRDTPPRFGERFLDRLQADLREVGVGWVATVIGRYWAMDRDKRWERVKRAYDLYVGGAGERAADPVSAARTSYERDDKGDEFAEPFVIGDPDQGRMRDGDVVLCFNFRSDRMRELVSALALDDFDGFERGARPRLEVVTMTQYRADYPFAVAYPPQRLELMLPEVVSLAGLRQKRMAETEKYAHVTFFFSGGREAELPGESRILVPSPKVATYDLQPEMSAPELTDRIVASVAEDETDLYVINYANADMVGHTGDFEAASKAVRSVDACLRRIVPAFVDRGGVIAITADHGNSEMLWDEENDQPHTAHTTNPVPFVLCGSDLRGAKLRRMGILADVAPTLLQVMGLPQPPEMTGVSMIE